MVEIVQPWATPAVLQKCRAHRPSCGSSKDKTKVLLRRGDTCTTKARDLSVAGNKVYSIFLINHILPNKISEIFSKYSIITTANWAFILFVSSVSLHYFPHKQRVDTPQIADVTGSQE